jgi:hypothetical protein
MPIDASIPLQFRPAVLEDPGAAQHRMLTLRNLAQQGQLNDQAIREGVLKQQSNQLALEAQQREAARDIRGDALFNPQPAVVGVPAAPAGNQQQIPAPQGATSAPIAVPRTGGDVIQPGVVAPTNAQIMAAFGPQRGMGIVKGLADAEEAHQKVLETKGKNATAESDYVGAALAPVKLANYDPVVFERSMQLLEDHDHIAAAKRLREVAALHPDNLQGIVDGAIEQSPEQTKLATERMTAEARKDTAATSKAKADAELPGLKANAELAERKLAAIANAKPEDYLALADQIVPPGDPANAALNTRTKARVSFALQNGDVEGAQRALTDAASETRALEIATDPRIAKQKININLAEAAGKAGSANAAAASGPLTPDDYKRAGAEFAITGVMPALGNGSGPVKQRLIHEKMEFARQSGLTPRDMALAGAAFKGDAKALTSLVTTRDQIGAAEQTAGKNLDLFIRAAKSIPDSGVPWLNTPLRMLDEKMFGSANMAAVNAARNVANNEIAKVTSGGGLGGVLSDNARHEVEAYNPVNATFKQTLALAKLLRQDMANRHASMDIAVNGIRDRMGTFGAAPAAPAAPAAGAATHRYNPATGKIEAVN